MLLQLWKAILSLETPDDEEITERWNETMFAVIRKRVYDVCMHYMILTWIFTLVYV